MIDVRQLREHADETCSALARRGDLTCDGQVKELLELDQQLREITARRDEARAKITNFLETWDNFAVMETSSKPRRYKQKVGLSETK